MYSPGDLVRVNGRREQRTSSSTQRSDKQRERGESEDLLIQRLMKARQEREGGSGSAGGGRC